MKITQLGKELSKDKYVIDLKAKSFSTTEDNLVLDFSDEHRWVFKTGSECVAVRRDIYEVIEIPKGKTIRLNGYGVKGYVVVEEPEPEAK